MGMGGETGTGSNGEIGQDKLGELEKLSAENEELIRKNKEAIEKLTQLGSIAPANFSDLTLTLSQVQEFYRVITKGPMNVKLEDWDLSGYFRDKKFNRENRESICHFMEVDFPAFFLGINNTKPDWDEVIGRRRNPDVVQRYNDLPLSLLVGKNGYSVQTDGNQQTQTLSFGLQDRIFKKLRGEIDFSKERNMAYLLTGTDSMDLSIQEFPERQFQLQSYTPKVNYLGNARYFAITEKVKRKPAEQTAQEHEKFKGTKGIGGS